MRRSCVIALAATFVLVGGAGARAGTLDVPWLVPPVDGSIERRFEEPRTRFTRGHRGIDLRVPAGTAVRAPAPGTVTFAGAVGDSVAVTILHTGGFETTYSVLSKILVTRGDRVSTGTWIGRAGSAHPGGSPGLHFGVKLEGAYVDPEAFLGPIDVARAIHLAPLTWRPPAVMGETFAAGFEVHEFASACAVSEDLPRALRPPNGNIAVAVAGIGSSTDGSGSAAMYEHGPEELGYPAERVYRFSYRGHRGPKLHEPYASADSWGDVRAAAVRLRSLMSEIARRHPGAPVDLIAHSQGGIVARTYLALVAQEWAADVPRVQHLVTFSSPHDGAPIADLVESLPARTLSGGILLRGISRWARSGGPIPDPLSAAVQQLRPGSELLGRLAGEDLVFGTRALALTIPHDVVVPANRAGLPEELTRAVAPAGLNGHAAIVSSPRARALAHAFLRDAADPCRTRWDAWAPTAGSAVERAERKIPDLVARLERAAIKRLIRLLIP